MFLILSKALFSQKYSSNIVKCYYNFKELFYMWIYCKLSFIPVIKAEFDPSEIILICWFAAQEKYLIIWKPNIFVEK